MLRKLFKATDHNRDGKVDVHELRSALVNLNYHDLDAGGIVSRVDTNGNGGIDLPEWLSGAPQTLREFVQKV